MYLSTQLANILITFPSVLIFILTISTIIAIRWEHVVNYKISDGFRSGTIAGIVMAVFLLLIAAPLISHPLENSIKIFSFLMNGQAPVNLNQLNLIPLFLTTSSLLILSSILGALYSALLATKRMDRIILGGILFGLAVWAILQYVILPNFLPLFIEKGLPPLWLASAFAIYGLVLGELIAYSHHWKNILDP